MQSFMFKCWRDVGQFAGNEIDEAASIPKKAARALNMFELIH